MLRKHGVAWNARTVSASAKCFLTALTLAWAIGAPSTVRGAWWTFGPRDGFSGTVRDMFEDRSGTIMLSLTDNSFTAYDGMTFQANPFPTYYQGDVRAHAFALTKDDSGHIWIARPEGWIELSPNQYYSSLWTLQSGGLGGGLEGQTASCGAVDRAGRLWFGTASGVGCFDRTTWTRYTAADGLGDNQVLHIAADGDGNIWALTTNGISRFNGATWTTFGNPPAVPSSSVQCIAVDRSGTFWIGASSGAYRFDGTAWTGYSSADGISSVHTICPDSRGDVWLGTDQGVRRFSGSRFRTVNVPVPGTAVKIFQDHLGALWFVTDTGGLARSDGVEWETLPSADFNVIAADHQGNIWCAAPGFGVNRYDGAGWIRFDSTSGLAADDVLAITASPTGDVWFGTMRGLSRFDGATWTTYTKADGLASDSIYALAVGPDGNLWAGTGHGASRFNGSSWTAYGTADGILGEMILALASDRQSGLLLGSELGMTRYDGTTFTSPPSYHTSTPVRTIAVDGNGVVLARTSDGTVSIYESSRALVRAFGVTCLLVDRGGLWAGTSGRGVQVYPYDDPYASNTPLLNLTTTDGLLSNSINAMMEDDHGDLWFACPGGIVRHRPDRVPPRAIIFPRPTSPSTSRSALAGLRATLGETRGIQFSTRFDGGAWGALFGAYWYRGAWSAVSIWDQFQTEGGIGTLIQDGSHTLEVRARDDYGNVDTLVAACEFEVDATPPAPVITVPAYGAAVRGIVPISGTTTDSRFRNSSVDVRPVGAASWNFPDARNLAGSSSPVASGSLATWDASKAADGPYEIRLTVLDGLGLTGTTITTVMVDNRAPFANQTTPVTVTAGGGDVYTINAEARLYFPPHAFAQDAVVTITPVGPGGTPSTLPGGAVKVLDGYGLAWGGTLDKAARLTVSYGGSATTTGTLALYRSGDNASWERVGGTTDDQAHTISAAVMIPGRYALFVDDGRGDGSDLSAIAFTPRVFSPTGAFADREVGISFHLGNASPVTVKVFSKSGRLIREVASGMQLNAGDNLIRWDGTDRNGGRVTDGLYFVTVEALGQTQTRTLAVVK